MTHRMIAPTKTERDAIKREYGTLFASISDALFEADPIGINFDDNTDEYDPETGTIIPRLGLAKSAEDVQAIVYEEFCRWFDPISAGAKREVCFRLGENLGALVRIQPTARRAQWREHPECKRESNHGQIGWVGRHSIFVATQIPTQDSVSCESPWRFIAHHLA